jgi:hypothetical protein
MKYVRPLSLFHELLKTSAINQGRFLGLDVGDKYVGLAVSDPLNKIASPLRYILRITVVFHFPYHVIFFSVILFFKFVFSGFFWLRVPMLLCFTFLVCWHCSVLLRKKSNIELMATDFQSLVSVSFLLCCPKLVRLYFLCL